MDIALATPDVRKSYELEAEAVGAALSIPFAIPSLGETAQYAEYCCLWKADCLDNLSEAHCWSGMTESRQNLNSAAQNLDCVGTLPSAAWLNKARLIDGRSSVLIWWSTPHSKIQRSMGNGSLHQFICWNNALFPTGSG
jgi:hypothetical protein